MRSTWHLLNEVLNNKKLRPKPNSVFKVGNPTRVLGLRYLPCKCSARDNSPTRVNFTPSCVTSNRELKMETFPGQRQLQLDVTSWLCNIAHALANHIAVVRGLFGVVVRTRVFNFHFNQVCCIYQPEFCRLLFLNCPFFESHLKLNFQAPLLSKLTSL